ncbi:MAG: hypothetical protein Q8K58_10795 [Acidimicrobiales bacterium]|nr:hypothetical protein [Acidimicrobiales bacterium]
MAHLSILNGQSIRVAMASLLELAERDLMERAEQATDADDIAAVGVCFGDLMGAESATLGNVIHIANDVNPIAALRALLTAVESTFTGDGVSA